MKINQNKIYKQHNGDKTQKTKNATLSEQFQNPMVICE
jgi:hypothetical protein